MLYCDDERADYTATDAAWWAAQNVNLGCSQDDLSPEDRRLRDSTVSAIQYHFPDYGESR